MSGRIDYAAVNTAARKVRDSLVTEFGGDESTDDFIELVSESRQLGYDDAAVLLVQRLKLNGATASTTSEQPLYGTETLKRPGKVLIVRDPDCAIVGARSLPRSPVLWFTGDPGTIEWTALKGRAVIVWLDGSRAGALIPLLSPIASDLKIVFYPPTYPRDWNIAQAEAENVTTEESIEFIRSNAIPADDWLVRERAAFDAEVPTLLPPADGGGEADSPVAEPDPTVPDTSVEEMERRFVYVIKGQLVADTENPQSILTYPDFAAKYAAYADVQGKGQPIARASLWRGSKQRNTVDKLGFAPNRKQRCKIDDSYCFNIWQPPQWEKPETIYAALPFIQHLEYLIPNRDHREQLLDWLAHAVQYPEIRPHHHYLLFAHKEGIGRSWMFNVLARMYAPHASDIEFAAILQSDFNAQLSGKIMMFCHEVKEIGGDRYAHRNQMKSLFTAQRITINQKHLPTWDEDFYCRFLMATNSIDALPVTETDRRVEVLDCTHELRGPDYWTPLYDMLRPDIAPAFLPALWWYLKERNIESFNPGKRAALSSAKQAMVDEQRSEDQQVMMAVIRACPYWAVASSSLIKLVCPREEGESRSSFLSRQTALAACIRDGGYQRYRSRLRVYDVQGKVWITDPAKHGAGMTDARQEAERAHQDFELHQWDASIVLEAWEDQKRRAAEHGPSEATTTQTDAE